MKITIHRGINQIGGCITEITTETTKIFIDLGHNLPKGDKPAIDENANKEAIEKLTKDCNAIFYTHYHGDHIDLFKFVSKTIPQYIGEIAKQVMLVKYKILAKSPRIKNITAEDVAKLDAFKTFKAKDNIKVGDISVTPYFVSHSACDSYMFLVESGEKRILHTGDFREHGYLGNGLEKCLNTFIIEKGVDVLITEGTMLSRVQEKVKSEKDLLIDVLRLINIPKHKYIFVLCSSTDIDRLASFHTASKMCEKNFLHDEYQGDVLKIFSETLGNERTDSIFNFDKAYLFDKIDEAEFEIDKHFGFCMLIRSSQLKLVKKLLEQLPQEESLLIYSMWDGYINENVKNGENLIQNYLNIWNLFENKEKIHTSGHATAETLAKVCELVNPRKAIIPIHSEHSADFAKLDISDSLKEKIITSQFFQF